MQYYNRINSVNYALSWWNKRNPRFYNFDLIGGDCTNFISQCLLSGGFKMNTNSNGWFYHSSSNRSPSWTGVNELYSFMTNNNSEFGPKAKLVTMEEIQVGDIVQMNLNGIRYHHSGIIVKILGRKNLDNILIACHTRDAVNKRLSDYNIKQIRFLKIFT